MPEPLNMALQSRVTDKGLKPGVGSWDAWVDLFKDPRAGRRKEDASCFVPAIFRDYSERKDANVLAMSAMVLDIDHKSNEDLNAVNEHLASLGFTYFAYSTSSDRPNDRHWRFVVPFHEPIGVSAKSWANSVWSDFVQQLGLTAYVDPRCCNASRAYFMPHGSPEWWCLPGMRWTPETSGVNLQEFEPPTPSVFSQAANGPVVRAARADLAALGQAIEGRGGDMLTFRAACVVARDYALLEEQALELLREWNLGNKPPWAVWQLEQKYHNAKAYGKGDGSPRKQVEMLSALDK